MNVLLIIHNIGFIVSIAAAVGIVFFLLVNNHHSVVSIMTALTVSAAGVFIISHLIGVNVSDPIVSRDALMFNLTMFFVGMFNVHAILAFLGKTRSRWYVLAIIYGTGLFLVVWFLIYPNLFLLPSVPKMYFPEYYNPGAFNWIRVAYLYGICVPYMLIEMFVAYVRSTNEKTRNQIKYFMFALIGGYGTGFMANFLVYNIPIDPLWGNAFIVFVFIPLIYGAVKYELFDIRIIAKQAFVYGTGISVVGGVIILFNYSNKLIETAYPGFPFWITPLVSAVLVVFTVGIVWRQLREGDLLKYEFITTVTHKFRTPLTHIRWASENLLSAKRLTGDDLTQVQYIQSADAKLVELTNVLMNISETENAAYEYHFEQRDLSAMAAEVADSLADQLTTKKLSLARSLEPGLFASFDESRIRFIIQTFVENAIHYTPIGGMIAVTTYRRGDEVVCAIKDSGIGISKSELGRLFSKFYRSEGAKLADTEGMGIGLYMSKEIIARHEGKVWAESGGTGTGSTFFLSLPKA